MKEDEFGKKRFILKLQNIYKENTPKSLGWGVNRGNITKRSKNFRDSTDTWDSRKQRRKAEQLWEILNVLARGVASGGMEQARDCLHLRWTTAQHTPEVEVQVKCQRNYN